MSRFLAVFVACSFILAATSVGLAGQVSGNYMEARTCDVYTGPCFANAEIGLAGSEGLLAWQVEEGSWNNVDISGLSVVAALKARDTLGMGGGLTVHPYPVKAVVIVDEKATPEQRDALVAFAKHQAGALLENVEQVASAPISIQIDFLAGEAKLEAGELAAIETRGMKGSDCVCTNEVVFYPPMTAVDNATPVFTKTQRFSGKGLGSNWTDRDSRSAFVATFSY